MYQLGKFGPRQLKSMGIPSKDELREAYYQERDKSPTDMKKWIYYVAFTSYRMASIAQGSIN